MSPRGLGQVVQKWSENTKLGAVLGGQTSAKWVRFEGDVPCRNSVTVGYRFPPGLALGDRKQGLSEMRCRGQ